MNTPYLVTALKDAQFIFRAHPSWKFSDGTPLENDVPVLMAEFARDQNGKLRSLLQQMLDVAENCDETGYADGVGFVDIDKLHAEVRAKLEAK